MSFGYSVGDFVLLTQLAWRTLQNARQACGEHDELAREASSLHVVSQRLETEVSKPHSILNSGDDDRVEELATLVGNCERVTNVLLKILEKYNALSEEKKRVTKLWKRVQFGNGEMQDLSAIRLQLSAHTNAIMLFLNLLAIGSQGVVEQHMSAQGGGEFRKIRDDINRITAKLQAGSDREGSILTSYTNDDKSFWKELRRELIKEGYSSKMLKKYKTTIKNYVHELGAVGALDELPEEKPEVSPEVTPELEPTFDVKDTINHSNLESTERAHRTVVSEAKTKKVEIHETEAAELETVPDKASKWEFVGPIRRPRKKGIKSLGTTLESGLENVDKNNPESRTVGSGRRNSSEDKDEYNYHLNGEPPNRAGPTPHSQSQTSPILKAFIQRQPLNPTPPTTFQSTVEQERSGLPENVKLKHVYWASGEVRIVLFGSRSSFDVGSLCRWICEWADQKYGIHSPLTIKAYSFRFVLGRFNSGMTALATCAPRVISMPDRELVQQTLQAGDGLLAELDILIRACEADSTNGPKLPAAENFEWPYFVDTMFQPNQRLEDTKNFMELVQEWNSTYNLTCKSILRESRRPLYV